MGYQSYSSGAKIMYFVTNTNFESNKLKKYIRQTIYSSSFFNYKLILLPHISFKPASFSQCNISLHPQSETQGRFERNTRTFEQNTRGITTSLRIYTIQTIEACAIQEDKQMVLPNIIAVKSSALLRKNNDKHQRDKQIIFVYRVDRHLIA